MDLFAHSPQKNDSAPNLPVDLEINEDALMRAETEINEELEEVPDKRGSASVCCEWSLSSQYF
jgi:hypothetical protein